MSFSEIKEADISKKEEQPKESKSLHPYVKIGIAVAIGVIIIAIVVYFMYRSQNNSLNEVKAELAETLTTQEDLQGRIAEQNSIINSLNNQLLSKDEAIKNLSSRQNILNGNLAQQPKYDLPDTCSENVEDKQVTRVNPQKQIQKMVNAKRETTQDIINKMNAEEAQNVVDKETQDELSKLVPKTAFIGEPEEDKPENDEPPFADTKDTIIGN